MTEERENWQEAKTITAGVDIGSLTAKVVILADNEIISHNIIATGADTAETSYRVMNNALQGTGLTLEDIQYIVGTGYGRFIIPFSKKNVTEISCHAKGAHWFFPGVRTVLDMGGQDCKVICCDGNGKVTEFLMNDKCAAGCGRSMEVMAGILSVPLEDIGRLSLAIEEEPPAVSSTCTVFAKSEALSLLRKGVSVNRILAAYCDALALRVINLIQRVELKEDFVISGGIAKNMGVVKRIEKRLGIKAHICFEPQIVGALGAALFARGLLEKSLKRG